MLVFTLDDARAWAGVALILLFSWVLSENRRAFPWGLAFGAIALQVVIVFAVFAAPSSGATLGAVAGAVDALTAAANSGARFVFDYLAGGDQPYAPASENRPAPFIFAFQVLPLILVVSALSALLWHWGVLKLAIRAFGFLFQRTLGLGGASAIAAASNIFLGMAESPLLIRGYLDRLTRSEVFLMMTVGFATVAGSTMVAYATILKGTLPNAAGHVLVASIISAPAAILLSRIMIPERKGEGGAVATYDASLSYDSTMDALTRGVSDGLAVVFNVASSLIVAVALIALANAALGALPDVLGAPLTLERMAGWAFAPLAWLIGVPWSEAQAAGGLLGVKLFLTEFVAFLDLGATPATEIGPQTRMILTYALCGFANFGSVAILAAGLAPLFPASRRREILELCWKSLVPGFLATCLAGAVVAGLPDAVFVP